MKTRLSQIFLTALLLIIGLSINGQAQKKEARLAASDSITVRISGVPADDIAQISQVYTISESGQIPLPYIGRINVAGMSASQLGVAIEQAYMREKIFTKPNIVVTTDGAQAGGNRRVIVGGEVKAPTVVAYRDGMTLFEAIMGAGGPTDFGNMKKVRLMRTGQTTEHNLTRLSMTNSDVQLKPDDKIVVPAR